MRYNIQNSNTGGYMSNMTISRPLEIVRGYRAIARRLHVGIETVRLWSSLGAPIRFDGQTPLAEVAELWAWSSGGNGLALAPDIE